MKVLGVMCMVWFLMGGSWPWIVGAWLLWEFGTGVKVLGSLWVSERFKDRD